MSKVNVVPSGCNISDKTRDHLCGYLRLIEKPPDTLIDKGN